MTGLSLKSAVFSLVMVCLLGGSALTDTFTFTEDAFVNVDSMDFILSGPSVLLHSGFNSGPNFITLCTPGALCTIPPKDIPTNLFFGFSGGEVGGVTADILMGDLTFSSFSFIADPDGDSSGPVTVTGEIKGYVHLPLGCDALGTCTTDIGPQVFDLQISGTGIGTASGIFTPDGELDVIHAIEYRVSGTATTVPEPSSLLLLSSGLIGFAALRRWHLLRRVNH